MGNSGNPPDPHTEVWAMRRKPNPKQESVADGAAYNRLDYLRKLQEDGSPARYFELTGSGGIPGGPGPTEAWVVEEVGDGIVARYRLEPRRGSLVVVEVEVEAAADAPGVTARVLRGVSPAAAVRTGMAALGSIDANTRGIGWPVSRIMGVVAPGVPWSDGALWRRIATPDRLRRLTREGRLALTARVYVDSLKNNDPKVNAAVAKAGGWTVAQSRERVREARREGYLTYSPAAEGKRRGRTEGTTTPKADALLAEIERTWLAEPPVVTVPRTGEPGLFDTYQQAEGSGPGA
jgi:hypothetical protein